jgi:hypothetical protein
MMQVKCQDGEKSIRCRVAGGYLRQMKEIAILADR